MSADNREFLRRWVWIRSPDLTPEQQDRALDIAEAHFPEMNAEDAARIGISQMRKEVANQQQTSA